MSLALYDYGLKLRAHKNRKAILAGKCRRVNIKDDALYISVVAMGGEHAGTWAVAVGTHSQRKPFLSACADPSNFYDLVNMWEELERHVSGIFYVAEVNGSFPQIVVANQATWNVLSETARRLSFASPLPAFRLAQMITYANERSGLPGDPMVVRMSELLSDIYVCGGEPEDSGSLQQVVAWIEGKENLFDVLEECAEDNECFLPRELEDKEFFKSYDVARQTWEDTRRNNESMKHKIKLKAFVKERWFRLKKAVEIYRNTQLVVPEELSIFEELCAKDFPFFMKNLRDYERDREAEKNDLATLELEEGVVLAEGDLQDTTVKKYYKKPSRYDSIIVALNKLADRNLYSEEWEKTLVWRDDHERNRAFADGRILDGVVIENGDDGKVCVLVEHDMLRIRAKEELTKFDEPSRQIKIVNLERDGATTKVWISGDPKVKVGENVSYGPRKPNPKSIVFSQISRRESYKNTGWTHNTNKSFEKRNHDAPADLLFKVNSVRSDNIKL